MMRSVFIVFFCGVATAGQNNRSDFTIGIELPTDLPVTRSLELALDDLGIDFVNYYVFPYPNDQNLPAQEVNQAMLQLCRKLSLDHALSCHHHDPPMECVSQSAAASATESEFLGVIFDELAHIRLLNYKRVSAVRLADTDAFQTFEQAHKGTLEGYVDLKERYEKAGAPDVIATHMWPVLLHTAGRAGFTVCPKICKELYSPVSMAGGIGAAKQYDRELWVDVDLWLWGNLPGHTAAEFRSNLLLAYWLGADRVYIEGAGKNLSPAGKQGPPFTLVTLIGEDEYQFTEYGEILRWFCEEYVPNHPRPWTFRDIKPNIAIVRFEDTCHGQRYTADWPDDLYGSPHLHSTPDTEAWFGLWNLLTHGATNRDGLSAFKISVSRGGYEWKKKEGFVHSAWSMPGFIDRHRFFVPLEGAVCYDHLVGYDLLKDIPLLFLTGLEVSDETMAAIRRCVQEGAICVVWGPLAKKHGFPDWHSGVEVIPEGKGKFVLTDDFGVQGVFKEVHEHIGFPNRIRYRFGDHVVTLERITDNSIEVNVTSP